MTGVQTLLVAVIIALTLLLMVLGVQVLLIALDLRKSIKRLNAILGDSIIGGGLLEPDKLTGIVEMFKKNKKMKTHGESSNKV